MIKQAAAEIDETTLIGKAKQGDRKAFGELVRRHRKGVVNVVFRMCGDAELAQDMAQESAEGQPSVEGSESVAVSLLMVSIPIEYRIKDIRKYVTRYVDPERVMESVAYQYLCDYAAGVDIDRLIGPGRAEINEELKGLIQARLDRLDLGIEIAFDDGLPGRFSIQCHFIDIDRATLLHGNVCFPCFF